MSSEQNSDGQLPTVIEGGLLSEIAPIDLEDRNMFSDVKETKVVDLIDRICSTLNINKDGTQKSRIELKERADEWAEEGEEILTNGGDIAMTDQMFKEVQEYFKLYEFNENKLEKKKEFEKIEGFIRAEKNAGRKRRETASLLAASEEVRVATELADLKAYRLKTSLSGGDSKLDEKIADAEKSHAKRKMIISRAARLATSDCREQFKRVRDFFQSIHELRKAKLLAQYQRSVKIQSMLHRLRKTDPRVMALEQNTAERIFRKKEADMTELNMVQNLEEATYLEKIITLLDDVQEAKENAADQYFQFQVKNLKSQRASADAREKELGEFRTSSMVEIAELIAKYMKEEMQDREEDKATEEMVERTERKKDFEATNSKVLLSISDLYDTILWSVATGSIGISSSSDSDSFDSFEDDSDDEEDERAAEKIYTKSGGLNDSLDDDLSVADHKQQTNASVSAVVDDSASVQSGSTANTANSSDANLSPVGHIFVKELKRELRRKEKQIIKRHEAERKKERKLYRAEAKRFKERHQQVVDKLLARCVVQRQQLRDAISRRMKEIEQKQLFSTQTLQEAIEADVAAMQQAWSEHKRLEEEQKTAFAKAQALVSAQVFHEVRNALSSVVAMSEMTSSLQKDPSVDAGTLVSSVSEMLDQNKEVVNYSLNMLNNILDVSKIKAGSFEIKEGFFDLQDLVHRATTMQFVKAQTRGVKMAFTPLGEPQIAYSDEDIVVRIITNFISNAVKFTTAGCVQPFVCPLESIDPKMASLKKKSIRIDTKTKKVPVPKKEGKRGSEQSTEQGKPVFADVKYMAVGVADTGSGLSKDLLEISRAGLFNSDGSKLNSGAKNSGFGLHLAHQLAGTLGSEINLTDLETFRQFCNAEMSSVLNADAGSVNDGASDIGSVNSDEVPGKGTVLYITIPVVSDRKKAISLLETPTGSSLTLGSSRKYIFSPQPAPGAADGCFRILVADDVAMLRKGLMRSVLDIFKQVSDCPISVSTACTAEDALRAIESNSYDMFICDNQFAAPTHLRRLPPEHEKTRYVVDSRGATSDVRSRVMKFFKNESFTIAPGDGSLSGLDALLKLAKQTDLGISIPILVLHSGHQLELPQQLGIIIVRKPLKRDDFVPMFERNAEILIEAGMCIEEKKGNAIVVKNQAGAQLFIKQDCIDYQNQESGKEIASADSSGEVRKRSTSESMPSQPSKKQKPSG